MTIENIREIPINSLSEIVIKRDGNCFFNCLSYYFRNTEQDSKEFRKIIYECIKSNREELLQFFPDENNELYEEKKKRFEEFIKNIAKDWNWSGDFEISAASTLFNVNIILLKREINSYKLLKNFIPDTKTKETIFIHFIANNHYNLLYEINNSKAESNFEKTINDIIKNKNKCEEYINNKEEIKIQFHIDKNNIKKLNLYLMKEMLALIIIYWNILLSFVSYNTKKIW